jgi:D-glycero-alpha-D-manno-heptose-7-phosphate kinase
MIIVRSPLRITLGGGGTDLPGWYHKHGGFLISAAINKYIYFTGCERPFDKSIWLSYSSVEKCKSVTEIKHDLFAKSLAKYEFPNGIEIHSMIDVPGKTGLGSSGSFLVGTLHLLNNMKKKEMSTENLAELACQIEMVELACSSGKQDQYIASFGGIVTMEIDLEGNLSLENLQLDNTTRKRLNQNILIYYTGVSRFANKILMEQETKFKREDKTTELSMKRIQEIAYESKKHLLSGDLDKFGCLLHKHWEAKKAISNKMSSSNMDKIYNHAMDHGALGGKVMGAGGGGYFMFYVPPEKQLKFRQYMQKCELSEMDWQFDLLGVTKIFSG